MENNLHLTNLTSFVKGRCPKKCHNKWEKSITWSSWFEPNVEKCWIFEPKNGNVKKKYRFPL